MKNERGTIGLKRPHFHFAKSLAAEASLTTKWLLRDQAVWTCGTGMDLLIHQVVKLEHVDIANCYWLLKPLACAPVEQVALTGFWKSRFNKRLANFFFRGTVKNRGDGFVALPGRGNPEMCLEDLTHIHTAWNAQRIQQDVNRCSIRQEWHIFHRHDF